MNSGDLCNTLMHGTDDVWQYTVENVGKRAYSEVENEVWNTINEALAVTNQVRINFYMSTFWNDELGML